MLEKELHKEDETRIISRLKSSGWIMAAGAETLGRAALTYENGRIVIELEQDNEQREMVLSLTSPDGRGVTVYPVYGNSLESTLDVLVSFQDRITPENFQEMLMELVTACPEVYIQEDEDGDPRLLTAD
ncbi:hypothetical protein AB0O39_22140 [Streptomyces anulatus]|uniref:hypothetical protein n=1 Tax=Streptomyces anulatus TaxID=1892 RepID=UPI003419877E